MYGFGHIQFYKNVDFLKNKNKSSISAEEGIKSIKIIDKIYSSSEISKEVFLSDKNFSTKLGK